MWRLHPGMTVRFERRSDLYASEPGLIAYADLGGHIQ